MAETAAGGLSADAPSPRAGAFIVTIYGDVVEPRGGRAWIGDVIETCAGVGISETLVRTAVHRLVAAGQLTGERDGRRSFYGLTAEARREYRAASDVLFGAGVRRDWAFVWMPPGGAVAALERAGFTRIGSSWLVGPADGLPADAPGVVFGPAGAKGGADLAAFVAAHWDLSDLAAAYAGFVARFAPLGDGLAEQPLEPAEALRLRLLLVHDFRLIALGDPRLPDDALPADWPGRSARRLFARLYRALSDAADAHVAERFVARTGRLERAPPPVVRRLEALAAMADG